MERDRQVVHCATATEAGETLRTRLEPGTAVLFKASRGVHLEQALELVASDPS
jgi:UDP-N-acetylmuramyl pentapeptide synthase